jgi:lysophospholipase L1-like esterase
MKKLFAAGCSFAHGHWADVMFSGAAQNFTQQYKEYSIERYNYGKSSWPWKLQHRFSTVINAGLAGGSQQAITRNTLRFLDQVKHELDDWVFVIQCTAPERTEYLDSYAGYHWNTVCFSQDPDTKQVDLSGWEYNPSVGYDYLIQVTDPVAQLNRFFTSLLLLTSVLDQHGVKYVVTGMSAHYPDRLLQMEYGDTVDADNQTLANLINTQHFIESVDTPPVLNTKDASPQWYDKCGHPNMTGHSVIAKYIYSKLTEKGYV